MASVQSAGGGDVWDVIVVGAGIEGSWTAYHSRKNGNKTLLLEQFILPHTRGSSHGQSRIIRKAYVEDHYAAMMQEAYDLWFDLEKEGNVSLYEKTGMLCIGKPHSEAIKNVENSLKKVKCAYKALTAAQLKEKFPMLNFEGCGGLFDEEAGILRADRCLKTVQELFVRRGGTLKDGEIVEKIIPGDIVSVTTSRGQYRAKSLIITAGPWTSKLTKPLGLNLPLQSVAVSVLYWNQKQRVYGKEKGFPTFINLDYYYTHIYGLPVEEYPGLFKLCLHDGSKIDPDRRDVDSDKPWDIEFMQEYVRKHFPYLEDKPSIIERCIYTNTPDHGYILDSHPKFKNIVIGAGFSGHGFKLAPVVGKVLTELATGRTPSYEMTPYLIARFGSSGIGSKL